MRVYYEGICGKDISNDGIWWRYMVEIERIYGESKSGLEGEGGMR